MAKDQASNALAALRGKTQGRGGKPAQGTATTIAAPEKAAPKKPFKFPDVVKFFREVRAEARKITWPSRKETWITSVMVFIMVLIATGFFFVTDLVLSYAVAQFIKIGG